MIDFSKIGYLESGNPRQRDVHKVLTQSRIMTRLEDFGPILIGTFPIAIDGASSDLDIACTFADSKQFLKQLKAEFSHETGFRIRQIFHNGMETVVCNFHLSKYEFEIFAQPIPVRLQAGYRHMIMEHRILSEKGGEFRDAIIRLKSSGMKTEPAFAKLLGLTGDPYLELLKLEPSNKQINK